MVGTLAQQVTLVSYGNEFLTSGQVSPKFYLENSTFQFCNNVNFWNMKKSFLSSKLRETVIAHNPNDWFTLLKNEKCKKLRLNYRHSKEKQPTNIQEHKLAGFVGGGGTWLIEAIYDSYSDYWANRWEVTNSNAPDQRIWSVNYIRVLSNQKSYNVKIDLESIKSNLSKVLGDIADFAAQGGLPDWADVFRKANAALYSQNPSEEYYHKDLIVFKNYELTAQQILFAAGKAWVFGGMGSWNDLGFEKEEDNCTYNRLSAQLYETICEAIVASTNSF